MKSVSGRTDAPRVVEVSPQRSVAVPRAADTSREKLERLAAALESAGAGPIAIGLAVKFSRMPSAAVLASNLVSAVREMTRGGENELAMSEDEVAALRDVHGLRVDGRLSDEMEGVFAGMLHPEARAAAVDALRLFFVRERAKD